MKLRMNKALRNGLIGMVLWILSLVLLLVDPISIYSDFYLRMSEGTATYNMWEKPPIAAYIRCYLFNYTNSEAFLSGAEDKIKVEEVGPFVYLEMRSNDDMEIDRENGVLRFSPRREVKFIPEMSIGHPNDVKLNVPNVPLLAISSMVGDSLVLSTGLNMIISSLGSKLMLNLTAQDYLWGYDDDLVHVAHNLVPSWIDFPKFGILDRMYDDKKVTVEVELADESKKYAIKKWDGEGGMKQWGYRAWDNSKCNQLNGTYEGLLFSPKIKPGDSVTMYRKQICRTLKLDYVKEKINDFGVKVFQYQPSPTAFDPVEENKCMCLSKCLKRGLSDLSPCYYRLPVAMSWPHFYQADPSIYEKIDGMKPDPKEHSTTVEIEPKHGIPLGLISSTQSNVVIENIAYSFLAKRFSNMVLPIVWMKMELQPIPDDYKTLLRLLYIHGPNIMMALEIIMGSCGVLLVFYQIFNLLRTSNVEPMIYNSVPIHEKGTKVILGDLKVDYVDNSMFSKN